MFPHTHSKSSASMAAGLVLIAAVGVGSYLLTVTVSPSAASTYAGQHHVFDKDTTFTTRFTLRPGDSVELRNGACLCFGPGGSADWRGTPTSTWSNDGNTQNLERDIEIIGSGHIRFEKGSGVSTIRYVEINLQPDLKLAEYSLHWHYVGDGSRGTLVEGVVVKNATNRAFVPHASHGITFRDTIAKNVTGSGYWWDPPPFQSQDQSNNSNDITYDHALVDGVKPFPGDKAHRLPGFTLGAGTGNAVINSAAMNVSGGKNSSGFSWPEQHHKQPGTWRFVNNVAHHNTSNGIFVWQNDSDTHIINGFRGYANGRSDIEHGAYANRYDYRNVTVESIKVHALGWSVTGGTVDTVTTKRHRLSAGPVTFTNVTVGRVIVNNGSDSGDIAGHYIFTNTGLTFNNVTVESTVRGTQITINGTTRFVVGGALSRFTDVSKSHLFYSDIEWLADRRITTGCGSSGTKFCPDQAVTREQMAAFLARALNLPGPKKDWFRDDNGSLFENDINRIADAGISGGCNPPESDRFCPDDKLNRGQMAAFLVRARGYTNDGGGNRFIDDDGLVFELDIDRLATAGVTKGCNPPTNNRFCPTDPVTRAHLAAFLHRAFG